MHTTTLPDQQLREITLAVGGFLAWLAGMCLVLVGGALTYKGYAAGEVVLLAGTLALLALYAFGAMLFWRCLHEERRCRRQAVLDLGAIQGITSPRFAMGSWVQVPGVLSLVCYFGWIAYHFTHSMLFATAIVVLTAPTVVQTQILFMRTVLTPEGIFSHYQFTPWSQIRSYRWRDNLFILQSETATLHFPVPGEKRAEFERIVEEHVPPMLAS